ncbi:MAG: DUF309 domain-containing protein [Paenisporosarcina sp.]
MHPLFHPLFLQYLIYFNDHTDYFECHEVLEEYWKDIAPNDKTHPLTAWILLATGMYHWRRGNNTGAYRSLLKAQKRFSITLHSTFYEGIQMNALHVSLSHAIAMVQQSATFQAFKISIESETLRAKVTAQIMPSSLKGDELIHKHMHRDRSEILKAREEKRRNRH